VTEGGSSPHSRLQSCSTRRSMHLSLDTPSPCAGSTINPGPHLTLYAFPECLVVQHYTPRITATIKGLLLFGYIVPLYVFLDGPTETDPRLKGYIEAEFFLRVVLEFGNQDRQERYKVDRKIHRTYNINSEKKEWAVAQGARRIN